MKIGKLRSTFVSIAQHFRIAEGSSYRSIDNESASNIRSKVRLYTRTYLQVKQRRRRSCWWDKTSSRVDRCVTVADQDQLDIE